MIKMSMRNENVRNLVRLDLQLLKQPLSMTAAAKRIWPLSAPQMPLSKWPLLQLPQRRQRPLPLKHWRRPSRWLRVPSSWL